MLICNQWFHAVLLRQSSGRESLSLKPLVTDKHPCNQIYIKKKYYYYYYYYYCCCCCCI